MNYEDRAIKSLAVLGSLSAPLDAAVLGTAQFAWTALPDYVTRRRCRVGVKAAILAGLGGYVAWRSRTLDTSAMEESLEDALDYKEALERKIALDYGDDFEGDFEDDFEDEESYLRWLDDVEGEDDPSQCEGECCQPVTGLEDLTEGEREGQAEIRDRVSPGQIATAGALIAGTTIAFDAAIAALGRGLGKLGISKPNTLLGVLAGAVVASGQVAQGKNHWEAVSPEEWEALEGWEDLVGPEVWETFSEADLDDLEIPDDLSELDIER